MLEEFLTCKLRHKSKREMEIGNEMMHVQGFTFCFYSRTFAMLPIPFCYDLYHFNGSKTAFIKTSYDFFLFFK